MPSEQSETPAQVASVPQEARAAPALVVGGVSGAHLRRAETSQFRLFFVGQLVSLTGMDAEHRPRLLVYQLTGSKILLGTVAAWDASHVAALPLGGSVATGIPSARRLLHPDRDDADSLCVAALVEADISRHGISSRWRRWRRGDGLHMPPGSVHGGMTSHEDL